MKYLIVACFINIYKNKKVIKMINKNQAEYTSIWLKNEIKIYDSNVEYLKFTDYYSMYYSDEKEIKLLLNNLISIKSISLNTINEDIYYIWKNHFF